MSEDNFEEPTEDLKLAEKILELTNYIQCISTKLESLSVSVENLEKKFLDFDVAQGENYTISNERHIVLQEIQSNQGEEIQELKSSILDHGVQINLNNQEIENSSDKFSESIGLVQQELKSEFNEQNENLKQIIQEQGRQLP